MDWESCCSNRIVKEVKPDHDMIKSLIGSSKNKRYSEQQLTLNDVTASSKLTLAYDSLRELLEAFALKHGYRVYNHECYCAFLKEIIGNSGKGDEFNDIRKLRNRVNYYGKPITAAEAKMAIQQISTLRDFISSHL